ncbi:hypothetical protein FNV43_RR00336 [Rhamnella rubrinervis]|uniref:Uncharacterized protein n=1 Tax=Rhamnella rubrinervis TaxID=2594499 RepID=A0A8K0HNZ0_9ROSA|nr:hypothetical protein FNV43_RR00336 [Rhamnella rubrinervis]
MTGGNPRRDDDNGSNSGDWFKDGNWASVVDGEMDEKLLKGNDEYVMEESKTLKKASCFSNESDDED